jgi:putative phage abortive infection protein
MSTRRIVLIFILVVALWLMITAGVYFVGRSVSDGRAVVDAFGAVNALFSGLAFGAVFIALVLQGEELRSQRAQFKNQAFESAFFQLLRLHIDILQSLRVQFVPGGETYGGQRAFTTALSEVEGRYAHDMPVTTTIQARLAAANRFYDEVCHSSTADFGHYFRNLYHIVKFIHETPLAVEGLSEHAGKRRYAGFVRAQLSQDELGLLFYNGLRREGTSKFKPLIEHHSLLHELRLTPTMKLLAEQYQPRAFGSDSRG